MSSGEASTASDATAATSSSSLSSTASAVTKRPTRREMEILVSTCVCVKAQREGDALLGRAQSVQLAARCRPR